MDRRTPIALELWSDSPGNAPLLVDTGLPSDGRVGTICLMCEILEGVDDANESEYQAALRAAPNGLVLALEVGERDSITVHKSTCPTISYSLVGARNPRRSAKVVVEDAAAMQTWREDHPEYYAAKLNHCSKCMPVKRTAL